MKDNWKSLLVATGCVSLIVAVAALLVAVLWALSRM